MERRLLHTKLSGDRKPEATVYSWTYNFVEVSGHNRESSQT